MFVCFFVFFSVIASWQDVESFINCGDLHIFLLKHSIMGHTERSFDVVGFESLYYSLIDEL